MCPGALDIDAYEAAGIAPPGSQPITLEVGTIAETVERTEALPYLQLRLTLEQSLEDFDGTSLREGLGQTYRVPAHLLSLIHI